MWSPWKKQMCSASSKHSSRMDWICNGQFVGLFGAMEEPLNVLSLSIDPLVFCNLAAHTGDPSSTILEMDSIIWIKSLTAPLKINMEHNHGGLVQMMFLRKLGDDFRVSAVNLFSYGGVFFAPCWCGEYPWWRRTSPENVAWWRFQSWEETTAQSSRCVNIHRSRKVMDILHTKYNCNVCVL